MEVPPIPDDSEVPEEPEDPEEPEVPEEPEEPEEPEVPEIPPHTDVTQKNVSIIRATGANFFDCSALFKYGGILTCGMIIIGFSRKNKANI